MDQVKRQKRLELIEREMEEAATRRYGGDTSPKAGEEDGVKKPVKIKRKKIDRVDADDEDVSDRCVNFQFGAGLFGTGLVYPVSK